MPTAIGEEVMAKDIRARYSRGKFEPLEELDLLEGEEVVISIKERRFAEESWRQLKDYAAKKAKESGVSSEEQVNELIYDQRRRGGS